MINFEAVKELLESQGKFDFKPFHFENAEQEYWAYKTNENKFHICDSDLKEIEKRKLPIKSWNYCDFSQKILFVLDREQDYLFLEEGESVSKIQEEQPDNQIKNIWLIEYRNDIIITKDIPGYRYIGNNWIILEPDIIVISKKEQNYWIPNRKIACYDPTNLGESDTFYCGTSYDNWDLFYCDNKYFIESRCFHVRNRFPRYYDNLIIWINSTGSMLINIANNHGAWKMTMYYGEGAEYIGSLDIGTYYNPNGNEYFANDNIFVFSDYRPYKSLWLIIDKNGNLTSRGEAGGHIVSISNEVIKLEQIPLLGKETAYDFYDYKGNCVAKDISKTKHFIIVSKSFNPALYEEDSEKDSLTVFKGVLNTQDHRLVVPIKYVYLELFDGGDFFYAITREEYTDNTGTRAIQYGLLYNNNVILPCNKAEIESLNENLFKWKERGKYGLISNGKICSECIYDNISIKKRFGSSKIQDKYLHDTYNYIKYSYAVLQADEKLDVFVPEWDLLITAKYTNIKAFVEESALLADGYLYKIKERELVFMKDMTNYDYVGGRKCYHLFREKGGDENNLSSYSCYYLCDSDCPEEDITNAEYDSEIDADREHIYWGDYRPVLALGYGKVFYSVKEDRFYDDINDLASYPDYYPDDDYDYERDTYYALGGDDYDRWKENGGDLDVMMERMGF